MTDATLEELLRSLGTGDRRALWDAIERTGDLLRDGALPEAMLATLGECLGRLAAHPEWEIRKAVAHAAVELQHESFHALVARLLADESPWVVEAAQRTLARRSQVTRTDLLREGHETLLRRRLGTLDAAHGRQACDAAMRVAEKYTEMVLREAAHEMVKVLAPLDAALAKAEAELRRPRIHREQCLRHLRRAQDRRHQLTSMMDALDAFTREVTPELCTENLRDMLEQAIEDLRDRHEREIHVELDVAPEITVEAHRHLLLQAFANVLQNAAEAYRGEERRRIDITARMEGAGHVVVRVRDFGCGISEETARAAFRLFVTSKRNGTGVGLPLARKAIEQEHNGRIRFAETAGPGATVVVVLPIEQRPRTEGYS